MASSSGGTRLHVARNSCSRPICRSTVQKKRSSVGSSFSCFIRLLSCLVSASLASHQNPSCQIYTWASAFSNKLAPPFSAKKKNIRSSLLPTPSLLPAPDAAVPAAAAPPTAALPLSPSLSSSVAACWTGQTSASSSRGGCGVGALHAKP